MLIIRLLTLVIFGIIFASPLLGGIQPDPSGEAGTFSVYFMDEKVGYGQGKTDNFDAEVEPQGEGYGPHGYLALAGSKLPVQGEIKGISLLNIAPTVLDILRLDTPWEMEDSSIFTLAESENLLLAFDSHADETGKDKEAAVRSRLEALGY